MDEHGASASTQKQSIEDWQWRCRAYSEGAIISKLALGDFRDLRMDVRERRIRGDVVIQYLHMLNRIDDVKRDNDKIKSAKFATLSQIVQNPFSFADHTWSGRGTHKPNVINGIEWGGSTAVTKHRFYCRITRILPKSDLLCTIFHSDLYRPFEGKDESKSLTKEMRKAAIKTSRLEHVTAGSIDALLCAHFGRGISLGKESLPGGWRPLCLPMLVRTSHSSREKCLFVVVGDEDLFFPAQDTPQVREAITNAWGIRRVVAISHHLIGHYRVNVRKNRPRVHGRTGGEESTKIRSGSPPQIVQNRGRYRRHLRWALKESVDGKPTQQGSLALHEYNKKLTTGPDFVIKEESALAAAVPDRGRRRRRHRRTDYPLQLSTINSNKHHNASKVTTAKRSSQITHNEPGPPDSGYGMIDPMGKALNADLSIRSIFIKQKSTLGTICKTSQDALIHSEHVNPSVVKVPMLKFSSYHSAFDRSQSSTEQSQTYFLMTSQTNSTIPMQSEVDMIVGVIIDKIGNIGSQSPGLNNRRGSLVWRQYLCKYLPKTDLDVFDEITSNGEQAKVASRIFDSRSFDYWCKFARVIGISRWGSTRLYSRGGKPTEHEPAIHAQIQRDIWGVLDVDNITASSDHPRSQATWTKIFEQDTESPICECERVLGTHRTYQCNNIILKEAIYDVDRSDNASFDDLLNNAVGASYRSYEYLRSLNLLEQSPELIEQELPAKLEGDLLKASPKDIPIQTYYLNYGLYCMQGLGVPKSRSRGIEWIRKAAVAGSKKAATILRELSGDLSAHDDMNECGLNHSSMSLVLSKKVILPQSSQGNVSYSFPVQEESLFRGNISVKLIDRTLDLQYPFPCGNLYLADYRWLYSHLDHVYLWSSDNDFVNIPDAPDQVISTLLKTQGEDGLIDEMANDIFLVNPVPNATSQYDVVGSLLHIACLFGLLNTTRVLVSRGYHVDAQGCIPSLATPIQCAAIGEHPLIIDFLVSAGAQLNPPMLSGERLCLIPSVFHLLVDWTDQDAAVHIAHRLREAGANINLKCQYSAERSASLTPLRYAIIRGRTELSKALVELDARFASRPSGELHHEEVCLLETRTIDVPILELYFDYIKSHNHKLPHMFCETPLGLLLDEDDGPQRSMRRGFNDDTRVARALDRLLELQPGYEKEVLAAIVRHDHEFLLEHILARRTWSVEWRWKGLTMLHLAVLYGRPKICSILLTKYEADATAVTTKRRLTCLHLLSLLPRHPQTDGEILSVLTPFDIPIDAKETVDDLTAFHIAVRNQKAHLLAPLLQSGANPLLSVYDRLGTLAEGRYGRPENVAGRRRPFIEDINIIGEVVLQFRQETTYSVDFVVELLETVLRMAYNDELYYLDSKRTVSLLHIIATFPTKDIFDKLFQTIEPYLTKTFPINVLDSDGDTPLHYAAVAQKFHNLRVLIKHGASTTIKNSMGLKPHELTAWSTIYFGGRMFEFRKNTHITWSQQRDMLLTRPDRIYEKTHSNWNRNDLRASLNLFQKHGHTLPLGLERFIDAWSEADISRRLMGRRGQVIPAESTLFLVPAYATSLSVVSADGSTNDVPRGDSSENCFYDVTIRHSPVHLEYEPGDYDQDFNIDSDDEMAQEAEERRRVRREMEDNPTAYRRGRRGEREESNFESDAERHLPVGVQDWSQGVKLTEQQKELIQSFFEVRVPLMQKMKRERGRARSL